MNRTIIPPKKGGETIFCPPQGFDFTPLLAAGETISSAGVSTWVYTGVDPNPTSIISGSAAISGSIVNQLITGGQPGTIYVLVCSIVTSLGQTADLIGYLAVVPYIV